MIRSKTVFVASPLIAVCALTLWMWADYSLFNDADQAKEKINQSTSYLSKNSNDILSTLFFRLESSCQVTQSQQSLLELRKILTDLPQDEALNLIRNFLARGEDCVTGLSFKISEDGSLSEWPTFRVFLLDILFVIDPSSAAAQARKILTTPDRADEWALALRNIAKGESSNDNKTYLRKKTEELIANPSWQAAPSIGYFNAFDVLVYIDATESMPLLSEILQRKDREDLVHAGFITLDRIAKRKPVDILSRLASDRVLQQSRPEMVAQQFARADVRDSGQCEILKTWLLDPSRTSSELRSFSAIYPNNNHFVSNNLLSQDPPPSGADLAAHDRAALEVVSTWLADSEFAPVREHLKQMHARLKGFVSEQGILAPSEIESLGQ